MTDIVTYCDVNTCEDCPRYGDDCDGTAERLYTHDEAWGMTDLISRADAIKAVASITMSIHLSEVICDKLLALPSADAVHIETYRELYERYVEIAKAVQGCWIPCSERLPDDLAEVNVTWVNHDPEPYYDFVKDKPASASAVFYKGKWFWYSSVCADILAEYGKNDTDEVDNAIEILAWMPLPKPYREDGEA